MLQKIKFKKYLLILLLIQIFFAHAVVFAQDSATDYAKQAGVSNQIKAFLCAPTEPSQDKGSTPIIGESTAAFHNTGSQDLYNCINRIYKFAIIFGSSVAVLMIVIAGYLYMNSGGNQESVDKAKSMLETSITALVILFGGYVLLRAINPDLIAFKTIQPPSVALTTSTTSAGPNDQLDQIGVPAASGGVCQEPVKNLCVALTSGCTVGQKTCGTTYDAAIANAASRAAISGINMQALIRSIMYNESSCQVNKQSNSSPPSCGLMQLQATTADRLKSNCGVTDTITCDWLKNSNNAAKSICIAAFYLKELTSTCGTKIVNIAAGYNAGSTACQNSVTCQGEQSCNGGAKRKWECMYNGSAGSKATCNTGYTETRNYAPKVYDCYNKSQ